MCSTPGKSKVNYYYKNIINQQKQPFLGIFGENFTTDGLWLLDLRDCVDWVFRHDFLKSLALPEAFLVFGLGGLFLSDVLYR